MKAHGRKYYVTKSSRGVPDTTRFAQNWVWTTHLFIVGLVIGEWESCLFTFEKWSHWESLRYLDCKLSPDIVHHSSWKIFKGWGMGGWGASLEGVHQSYQEVSIVHVTVLKNHHGLGKQLRVYKTIHRKLGCFLRGLSAVAPFFNFDIWNGNHFLTNHSQEICPFFTIQLGPQKVI